MTPKENTERRDESIKAFAERKSAKKKVRKYMYIVSAFALAAVFIVVCFVFFFKVREVSVEGAERYSDDLLIIKSGITVGENLYSYKESEIEKKIIYAYPYVSRVKLKRVWPDRIILRVTEEEPKYVTTLYGEKFVLSDSMRIVENPSAESDTSNCCKLILPEIDRAVVGNNPVFTNDADYIEKVLKKINASELSGQITLINLENKFGIYLLIGSRYKIKCGNTDEFELKLSMAYEILNSGKLPELTNAEIDVSDPAECTAIIGSEARIS